MAGGRGETDVCEALSAAVVERDLPTDGSRYGWARRGGAGQPRGAPSPAPRARVAAERLLHLRATAGHAEKWNARYEEVADQVIAEAHEAEARSGGDEGAYLDALDDIYDKAGL